MGTNDVDRGRATEAVIARPASARTQCVYKVPDQAIPMRAQLTVESDEVALFFKDGRHLGSLPAGRHTLDTSSTSFLGPPIDRPTSGSVFTCEVYFVTTRELPSIGFGTSIGDVRDPQTLMRVRLTVNGDCSARVVDPTRLVTGLVGLRATTDEAFLGWLRSQVHKAVEDGVAAQILQHDWPLLRVTSGAYTAELVERMLAGVRGHVEPYGVEVTRFGALSVGMDQADRDRLDKHVDRMAYVAGAAAEAGGRAAYQQLGQAELLMGAAEGMGRRAGAGVGMNAEWAGLMANAMGSADPAQARRAQQPPPESREQIMAMIKQLDELRRAGLLDEAELAAKKRDLLAKL